MQDSYNSSYQFIALSCSIVSPAKTAEFIEMLFGLWTWVGPGNHVLDGDPDLSAMAILRGGNWLPILKYRDLLP